MLSTHFNPSELHSGGELLPSRHIKQAPKPNKCLTFAEPSEPTERANPQSKIKAQLTAETVTQHWENKHFLAEIYKHEASLQFELQKFKKYEQQIKHAEQQSAALLVSHR